MRNVQRLGLKTQFETDILLHKGIKMIIGLPLLPERLMRTGFECTKDYFAENGFTLLVEQLIQ